MTPWLDYLHRTFERLNKERVLQEGRTARMVVNREQHAQIAVEMQDNAVGGWGGRLDGRGDLLVFGWRIQAADARVSYIEVQDRYRDVIYTEPLYVPRPPVTGVAAEAEVVLGDLLKEILDSGVNHVALGWRLERLMVDHVVGRAK